MQQLQQQVTEGVAAAASLQRDKEAAADQLHQVHKYDLLPGLGLWASLPLTFCPNGPKVCCCEGACSGSAMSVHVW